VRTTRLAAVVVHVDDPRFRDDALSDFVHVRRCRQPGADVEELPDPRLSGEVADQLAQVAGAAARALLAMVEDPAMGSEPPRVGGLRGRQGADSVRPELEQVPAQVDVVALDAKRAGEVEDAVEERLVDRGDPEQPHHDDVPERPDLGSRGSVLPRQPRLPDAVAVQTWHRKQVEDRRGDLEERQEG